MSGKDHVEQSQSEIDAAKELCDDTLWENPPVSQMQNTEIDHTHSQDELDIT